MASVEFKSVNLSPENSGNPIKSSDSTSRNLHDNKTLSKQGIKECRKYAIVFVRVFSTFRGYIHLQWKEVLPLCSWREFPDNLRQLESAPLRQRQNAVFETDISVHEFDTPVDILVNIPFYQGTKTL